MISSIDCPKCRADLVRTWRRPVDRMISHFVPVQRYRCEGFGCGWEGNFRAGSSDFSPTHGEAGSQLNQTAVDTLPTNGEARKPDGRAKLFGIAAALAFCGAFAYFAHSAYLPTATGFFGAGPSATPDMANQEAQVKTPDFSGPTCHARRIATDLERKGFDIVEIDCFGIKNNLTLDVRTNPSK